MKRCILPLVVGIAFLGGQAAAQPDFAAWTRAAPERAGEVLAFETLLDQNGVGQVLPARELLRNATSWRACKLEWPWSMPPRALWGHIVPTLAFIRDEVVPRIGPVRVESGWREPKLNACAGGAGHSAHALFYALDLKPQRAVSQKTMIEAICKVHRERGAAAKIGLGFYGGVRFHVDTKGFRRWGSDNHSGTSPCAKV